RCGRASNKRVRLPPIAKRYGTLTRTNVWHLRHDNDRRTRDRECRRTGKTAGQLRPEWSAEGIAHGQQQRERALVHQKTALTMPCNRNIVFEHYDILPSILPFGRRR